jgi:hypothetical protein
VVIFLLVFVSLGAAFGQSPNAISVDIMPLAKGLIASNSSDTTDTSVFGITAQYERGLADHYGIGVRMEIYSQTISVSSTESKATYFGLDAFGRVYPFTTDFQKFFIGVSLGFNTLSASKNPAREFSGLTFALKAGWKQFLLNKIFLEPSIAIVQTKPNALQAAPQPGELETGFLIGMSF